MTTYQHDALGRTIASINALGETATQVYDAVGNQVAMVDALNRRTSYHFDALRRVLSTEDALGQRTSTEYDAVGNAVAMVNALNQRQTFQYDALNRMEATIDALGNRTTTVFDALGRTQAMIDALGNRTTYQFDAGSQLLAVRNALNQLETYSYDAAGNRISTLNAAGERTTTVFDALNRSVASVNGLGHRHTQQYDVVGNVVTSINPLNHVYTFSYDALNRRESILDPLGNRTTTTFDAVGNMIAQVNARGFTTTSTFDALDRLVSTTDPLNRTTTTVFDAVGNAITQIDALGYRTTSTFDALNRRVSQLKPLGGVTTWSYDAVNQLLAMTDALNHTTTFGYDAAGQRVTVTDALNFTTTSVFDARGNRTALVDASGNRTTWVYDTLARVAQEISPNNGTTSYTYDAAGRTADVTDALGRKKAYGYDAAGRNITVAWYSAVPSLIQTNTFTFDDANRMVGAANANGAYTFTLDAVGRVNEVAEPFGLSLTFAYDAVGNRTRVQDSKGGVTTSTFDAASQLTRREFTGQGTELRIDYAYTGRGQIYNELRLADLAGTQRVGDTIYAHDEEGRVYDLKHRGAIITDIVQHDSFTYDLANRLTSRTLDGVTTSFVYDTTNQLIKDGATPTITYDATGNRTNSGYATTTGNRITNDGTWAFTYDAVGNIVKKSKGASAETWTYAYDHNNQMTAASKYATDGGTLLGSVEYAFDVFGNRLSRIQKDGSGTPTSTERFGYDGWDTAKPGAIGTENFDTWADLDGSNALVNRRIFDAGFDHLSAKISSAGSTNWYLGDLQGSVTHLTNAAGTIIGTITYDAFGNTTSSTGTTDRYTYTAREWDAFAGLQYNRARMYDPAIGRWYSTDPIGFEAGDTNLYRYVGNGYVNATDPSGRLLFANNSSASSDWGAWLTQQNIEFKSQRLSATAWSSNRYLIWLPPSMKDKFRAALEGIMDKNSQQWLIDATVAAAFDGDLGEKNIELSGNPANGSAAFEFSSERTLEWAAETSARLKREWEDKLINKYKDRIQDGLSQKKINTTSISRDGSDNSAQREWLRQQEADVAFELMMADQHAADESVQRAQAQALAGANEARYLEKSRLDAGIVDPAKNIWEELLRAGDRALHPDAVGWEGLMALGGLVPGTVHIEAPATRGGPVATAPRDYGKGTRSGFGEGPAREKGTGPAKLEPPTRPSSLIPPGSVDWDASFKLGQDQGHGGCFATGTHLRTLMGSKAIEDFVVGDKLLSRPEYDTMGAVQEQEVEAIFRRVGRIVHLHIRGQVIRVTIEHPFYAYNKGWVTVGDLEAGDRLLGMNGEWFAVQEIFDTGIEEAIYNLRVKDWHTYFVGGQEWGFSVWAHNFNCGDLARALGLETTDPRVAKAWIYLTEFQNPTQKGLEQILNTGGKKGLPQYKKIEAAFAQTMEAKAGGRIPLANPQTVVTLHPTQRSTILDTARRVGQEEQQSVAYRKLQERQALPHGPSGVFSDVALTEAEANNLVREIIDNATVTQFGRMKMADPKVLGLRGIAIFDNRGRGVLIHQDGRFITFLESEGGLGAIFHGAN